MSNASYPLHLDHSTIYYKRNEFCGWPFHHGFWAFVPARSSEQKQEVLVSFSRGSCSYEALYDMGHGVVVTLGGE